MKLGKLQKMNGSLPGEEEAAEVTSEWGQDSLLLLALAGGNKDETTGEK